MESSNFFRNFNQTVNDRVNAVFRSQVPEKSHTEESISVESKYGNHALQGCRRTVEGLVNLSLDDKFPYPVFGYPFASAPEQISIFLNEVNHTDSSIAVVFRVAPVGENETGVVASFCHKENGNEKVIARVGYKQPTDWEERGSSPAPWLEVSEDMGAKMTQAYQKMEHHSLMSSLQDDINRHVELINKNAIVQNRGNQRNR